MKKYLFDVVVLEMQPQENGDEHEVVVHTDYDVLAADPQSAYAITIRKLSQDLADKVSQLRVVMDPSYTGTYDSERDRSMNSWAGPTVRR